MMNATELSCLIKNGGFDTTTPYPTLAEIQAASPRLQEVLRAERIRYRQEAWALQAGFLAVLPWAFGVQDHPKAAVAVGIAWERGHASGYEEVLLEFEELAELLR
jgi:hypothetical protein